MPPSGLILFSTENKQLRFDSFFLNIFSDSKDGVKVELPEGDKSF